MNIAELMRENIRNLAPYSTARDEYGGEIGIYLDANENPYDTGYNRYPDPHHRHLRARLAQIKGVPAEHIFIGNGSDEPIDLVFRVFCRPGVDNAVSISPTYGMYRVAAATNDVQMREVALEADFSLDTEKLFARVDDHTKLLFICSPNNPTGNSFARAQLERIIRDFRGIVVLDEAYIDFSEQKSLLDAGYENLVVLQTLSKAWGMAGLRLGLAFSSPLIIATLNRIKYPYNINVVTQNLVLELLDKSPRAQIEQIVHERARVAEALSSLELVRHVYASDANFLLVRVDHPRDVYAALIREGVIVRDRSSIAGCEGCLRVTIGTPEENKRLIEIMTEL